MSGLAVTVIVYQGDIAVTDKLIVTTEMMKNVVVSNRNTVGRGAGGI